MIALAALLATRVGVLLRGTGTPACRSARHPRRDLMAKRPSRSGGLTPAPDDPSLGDPTLKAAPFAASARKHQEYVPRVGEGGQCNDERLVRFGRYRARIA